MPADRAREGLPQRAESRIAPGTTYVPTTTTAENP
jgi:hypothetical protein